MIAGAAAADARSRRRGRGRGRCRSRPGGRPSGRARRWPSSNWRRTRWPGPFGATMPTSTPGGGSIWPKWIAKPWANSSRLPAAIPSAISASQISACFSSGSRIITTSPRLAASATSSTSRPAASASARLEESGRRPTTTSTPGVLQVERVGVALGAVAEDGDGLALELRRGRRPCRRRCRRFVMGADASASRQAQLAAHQLARGGARQRRGELDPLRDLEAGQRLGAVAAQLVRRRPRRRPRGRRRAVTACCHSGSARPTTAASATSGWRSSTCLDLGRDHVLAAADDHVVDAGPRRRGSPPRRCGRGRRCAASRRRRRSRGRRSAPGRGSRRPGSAGGWSAAAGPAEPSLRSASAGRERRHLRAGLGQAVGLDHGRAPAERLLERRPSGTGPPPTRIARGAGEVGAGLEQPGQHRRRPARRRVIPSLVERARRPGRRRSRRGPRRWCRRSPSASRSRARRRG